MWGWIFIYLFISAAGAQVPKFYTHLWYFFEPLQDLWIFLIYMHQEVKKAKNFSNRNISWANAFALALRRAIASESNLS